MENVEEKVVNTANKISYEDLERLNHQLSEQARSMYRRIKELENTNILSRLSFLFKVVEFEDSFSFDFVTECVNEIMDIMRIPKDEEEKTEDK